MFNRLLFCTLGVYLMGFTPLNAQTLTPSQLDIPPEVIEDSPTLQRWLEKIPDVSREIRRDPSFKSRLRLGYAYFPSSDHGSGVYLGFEDLRLGKTPLTLRGEYQESGRGDRLTTGFDLQYYTLPLGLPVNIAPLLGYRYIQTDNYSTDGVNVGARLLLVLSRTGAADIALTQSFVSPTSGNEVGITSLSVGYAVTRQVRIAADIQAQNSRGGKDSRVGILLEWQP